ncbi:MAG: DNA mismatch repair endonuclease MutL [Desulfuromonadaceae bacterium]|nr:DNA mismatch repair endonuclease MutL [Desulfuromonadaceae bacterium]
MASRIAILPEKLCNQIAAGEVVERPASVVKELVENALDAQADWVRVEVEGGGRKLIRVSDNGHGMTHDDVFLCFERHATSKIRQEADLFQLHSLGFRGEALPSIAAVSRLTVSSRCADDEVGLELELSGGVVRHRREVGRPPGTAFTVRDLFFNVPARRKFLRKEETEFGHISEVVTRLALACPFVQFQLVHNGRVVLDFYRHGTLKDRIASVLGRSVVDTLVEVNITDDDLRLHGFIARSEHNRSSTQHLYTYVNGRFIRDRVIQHAVLDGYRQLLMKGRYPLCVLFLDLPTDQVDVNVHPTKHEVRFHNQRLVHDFISHQVRQLLRPPQTAEAEIVDVAASRPDPVVPERSADARSTAIAEAACRNVFCVGGSPEDKETPAPPPMEGGVRETTGHYLSAQGGDQSSSMSVDAFCAVEQNLETPQQALPIDRHGFFTSLEVLGQYAGSYLVCQDGEDLLLIDQHAAHERIGYQRLKSQLNGKGVEKQELLFPEVIELTLAENSRMAEFSSEFERLAFELEPFGGTSWALTAIPAFLAGSDCTVLVRDMLADFAEWGKSNRSQEAFDALLIRMACHTMIRANQRLDSLSMRALLRQLDEVDFNRHCPHGRPVMQRIRRYEIEKMFRRV